LRQSADRGKVKLGTESASRCRHCSDLRLDRATGPPQFRWQRDERCCLGGAAVCRCRAMHDQSLIDSANCVNLYRSGQVSDRVREVLELLAGRPDNIDAHFLLTLSRQLGHEVPRNILDEVLSNRSADDCERMGIGLRAAGLHTLASVAFKTAAARDAVDPAR